jgi:glucose/arabinose dehydrogenase
LLGLAFSPDGRFLYLDSTDRRGDTNVVEYAMGDGGAPDLSTARLVLLVQQPRPTHNGGDLAFGPDGDLYIAMGDGGGAGDPYGNGQNLSVLLGKILRIDPRPSDDEPYEVPVDNPFVGRPGTDSEIWAYGLRNPWRFSFDRETGDLWIGDVGQMSWEEVDHQPAGIGGENYGWDGMEGTHARAGATPVIGPVAPVFEYPHEGGGCAVIGGYVYRGRAIPSLRGSYVFTDLCTGDVMAFRLRGAWAADVTDLRTHIDSPVSFGEDQEGELYVLSLTRGVVKIVPGG